LTQLPARFHQIRSHAAPQLDLLSKRFQFGERYELGFRGEAFNATNTPLRQDPPDQPIRCGFRHTARAAVELPARDTTLVALQLMILVSVGKESGMPDTYVGAGHAWRSGAPVKCWFNQYKGLCWAPNRYNIFTYSVLTIFPDR
jgi:hypothetical protein